MSSASRFRLVFPEADVTATAIYYRTHLGHRNNATHLGIKLIRKAAEIERKENASDALLQALGNTMEEWAINHMIQGVYLQEYHQWERDTKEYLLKQRKLNTANGDFDWGKKGKSFIELARENLSFFGAVLDEQLFEPIDAMRNKVNELKHDPIATNVELSDYSKAIKQFEKFWDRILEIESGMDDPNVRAMARAITGPIVKRRH